jgi:hypothetical protein
MCAAKGHVRFTLESGHVRCISLRLLWTKSGHGEGVSSIGRGYSGPFLAKSPKIQRVSPYAHPSSCCIMSQQFSLRFNDSQSLPATPCDMNATWNTSFAARVRRTSRARSTRVSSCYLGRNRRHVRSCRFKCLCISVRLPIRFVFPRRSPAFDLILFGLSLFGHVIASRKTSMAHFDQSTGTNSGGNVFLPFGIET